MRRPSASLKRLALALFLCAAPWANGAAAQEGASAHGRVRGVVRDAAGAPVEGAEVSLAARRAVTRRVVTGEDGRFLFEGISAREGSLSVRARGFASAERRWSIEEGGAAAEVVFVLAPAQVSEQVTVTATRTEVEARETAASVTVVSADALAATPALTLDDALRQVPGFQLFRRAGSRAANPTTQGVSLRGVGPSGASRALVLLDGVPLNDPFGGWVYWGRVARESAGRVEVVRGGASHLYGSAAMGGVIQILTREAEDEPRLSLTAAYGTQATHDVSLFAAARKRGWALRVAAEKLHTGGYFLVRRGERGGSDARAAVRFGTLSGTVERDVTDDLRLFARGSYYGEARDNGTRLQHNRTHLREAVAGLDWRGARAGVFAVRSYASAQVFDQTFSALSADRDAETLTRVQRVPSQAAGFSLQWTRALGARHALVVGFEAREVRGASDELIFTSARPSLLVGAGGRERAVGVFVEDLFQVTPRLSLSAGVRFDRWRNFDASELTTPLARPDLAAATVFADRAETAFSPRASLLYRLTDSFSFYASGYRAFRAPTLNELYRDFRVGNVLTLANEGLRAERLTGGEAGASFNAAGGRVNGRGAFFWLELTRAVANVTLAATPALITRRRQNLGRTRSRGVEFEAAARLSERWSLDFGYQLTGATVVRFPASAELEGRRVPQVPRHQLTFGVVYEDPARLSFSLQGRAAGSQFDDDLNLFRLGRLFTLDALASRRVTGRLELFVAAENLTGRRYEVGRTPVVTLGPPLSARFGLRVR